MTLQTNQGDPDAASALYTEDTSGLRSEEMILNLGPQHPSTSGVLRLVLTLEGETVVKCTPVIGYLHRGMEKIFENRPYIHGARYIDNADYLNPMINETAYVGAIEAIMGVEPPRRAQYIRLLVSEMARIASHLVAIGTYGLDLGAFTPVLWCFRDREGLMDMFESLSGHRFTHNYMRPGGVVHDFPSGWMQQCEAWMDSFEKVSIPELHELLTGNEIFDARTQGVGYIDPQQAVAYGGDRARCARLWRQLRSAGCAAIRRVSRSRRPSPGAAGRRLLRALSRAHAGDGRECAALPRSRWRRCLAARSRNVCRWRCAHRAARRTMRSRAGVVSWAST